MLGMQIDAATIGEAWLAVAGRILEHGAESTYDASPTLELLRVTLSVARPASFDPVVSELGDAERLAWMHANFTDHAPVAELGDARSYASRLYDYAASGRDQVRWVIDRLRHDPTSRSATITTFEPLLDSTYIPCVSLLDFWISGDRLAAIAYAHSIDFGTKGYGNLVELAYLMERIADELGRTVGPLDFVVKSAHIYAPELETMRAAVSAGSRTDFSSICGIENSGDLRAARPAPYGSPCGSGGSNARESQSEAGLSKATDEA